jgi:hypothetical protein
MFVYEFFYFLNNLKVYHWATGSYARHKASDDCFSKIQALMDQFVETYIGKYGRQQILHFKAKHSSIPVRVISDADAKNLLKHLILYLKDLQLDSVQDSDLVNIRDEMVSSLNQTMYLFTLS